MNGTRSIVDILDAQHKLDYITTADPARQHFTERFATALDRQFGLEMADLDLMDRLENDFDSFEPEEQYLAIRYLVLEVDAQTFHHFIRKNTLHLRQHHFVSRLFGLIFLNREFIASRLNGFAQVAERLAWMDTLARVYLPTPQGTEA